LKPGEKEPELRKDQLSKLLVTKEAFNVRYSSEDVQIFYTVGLRTKYPFPQSTMADSASIAVMEAALLLGRNDEC
jgi:hypothetical protein